MLDGDEANGGNTTAANHMARRLCRGGETLQYVLAKTCRNSEKWSRFSLLYLAAKESLTMAFVLSSGYVSAPVLLSTKPHVRLTV